MGEVLTRGTAVAGRAGAVESTHATDAMTHPHLFWDWVRAQQSKRLKSLSQQQMQQQQ